MVKNKVFKAIALFSSKLDSRTIKIATQVKEILENIGISVYISDSLESDVFKKKELTKDSKILSDADLLVAIGGDGTLLSSARKFGFKGLPILGINLGNLGFLTDIAPENLTTLLLEVLEGKYTTDERFFLTADINGNETNQIALNEIVVHSKSVAQLLEYEISIDGDFVYRQKADGVIVSSPTGSTAYSMSGSGSIIHPSVNCIHLLPMFPHSLSARPLLINDNSKVQLKLYKKSGASVSFDSHNKLNLKNKDVVTIAKAKSTLSLIHPLNHNFYTACRTKLGWSL
tara:strand:+ start:928 stop:1788 length:861 start_codon:yes stop_codon:yes gene_type:complete